MTLVSVPGQYLLVIGEVVQEAVDPYIRAIKIQDLTSDPMAHRMWKHEVLDLQAHVWTS